MKSTAIILAALAVVFPASCQAMFYNWTEEKVVADFKFEEFSNQQKWYELKWWANETDSGNLENMYFYVSNTSSTVASATLVGTRSSDVNKCVYLSGSGKMAFSVADPAVPAKMTYYISPKYGSSRYNVIAKGAVGKDVYLIAIVCSTVEANGECSKGLKINAFGQNRVMNNDTENAINTAIDGQQLSVGYKDFTTTKQNKDCEYPEPIGGATHVTFSGILLTLLTGLLATILH